MDDRFVSLEDWKLNGCRILSLLPRWLRGEPAYQVARLRLLRGLTQRQLADLVGTKQSSIARLERGTTPPNLSFLSKVAAAPGVRVEVHLSPVQD